jgi:tripartite ATP-independent transporter DctM subunit
MSAAISLSLVLAALLLVAGTPIAFVIGLPVVLYLFVDGSVPLTVVPQMMTGGVNSFSLMAIPFFLLAGTLMNTAGITLRLFRFAGCLVRHIPGGLGHVNVVASMIFAGMSGSAVADAAGLGTVEIEAMRKEGYDAEFAAGITAASSTIGPVIPPSIIFVIYGVIGEVSIGALFLAGAIPGLMMGLALMAQVYLIAAKRGYRVLPRASLRELSESFRAAILPLLTPVIIVGGILAGVFTPTEASVVAVVYALILGLLVYRELTWRDLGSILWSVAYQTATIMMITATANVLGWVMARGRLPQTIAEALLGYTSNWALVLLVINLLLFLTGTFMEVIAALVILTPVLVPIVKAVGIDPVHFGVVMSLNLMIGLLTPPVGMALYTVQRVAGVSFARMVRGTVPFILPLIVVLALISYVPGLVLFLPRLLRFVQ